MTLLPLQSILFSSVLCTGAVPGHELPTFQSLQDPRPQAVERAADTDAPEIDPAHVLHASDSEKALELQIADYFETVHEWKLDRITSSQNPDDVFLKIEFGDEEQVPLVIFIDAKPSAHRNGEVVESRVLLTSYVPMGVVPGHPKRGLVLEALNETMNRQWTPQQFYLDSDGDLAIGSNVNIAETEHGLHAENIADLVIRTVQGWAEIGPFLESRGCPIRK